MLLGRASAWPLTVRAQRPTVPVIGFLYSRSEFKGEPVATAFRRGLRDAGMRKVAMSLSKSLGGRSI
jgi:hypothetical protein